MDFVCKNCGKPHGVMTIINGEIMHLTCQKELETESLEIEEIVIEE